MHATHLIPSVPLILRIVYVPSLALTLLISLISLHPICLYILHISCTRHH